MTADLAGAAVMLAPERRQGSPRRDDALGDVGGYDRQRYSVRAKRRYASGSMFDAITVRAPAPAGGSLAACRVDGVRSYFNSRHAVAVPSRVSHGHSNHSYDSGRGAAVGSGQDWMAPDRRAGWRDLRRPRASALGGGEPASREVGLPVPRNSQSGEPVLRGQVPVRSASRLHPGRERQLGIAQSPGPRVPGAGEEARFAPQHDERGRMALSGPPNDAARPSLFVCSRRTGLSLPGPALHALSRGALAGHDHRRSVSDRRLAAAAHVGLRVARHREGAQTRAR